MTRDKGTNCNAAELTYQLLRRHGRCAYLMFLSSTTRSMIPHFLPVYGIVCQDLSHEIFDDKSGVFACPSSILVFYSSSVWRARVLTMNELIGLASRKMERFRTLSALYLRFSTWEGSHGLDGIEWWVRRGLSVPSEIGGALWASVAWIFCLYRDSSQHGDAPYSTAVNSTVLAPKAYHPGAVDML